LEKRLGYQEKVRELWERIGQRHGTNIDFDSHMPAQEDTKVVIEEPIHFQDQTEAYQKTQGKTHWDFLLKEMVWMADDFDKEQKKKCGDAKKFARNSKKNKHEKQVLQEKAVREQKVELKRKSKFMSNIVQMYWKSCEKIVKHNYNVDYERKRQ
jgi:hypothetical protein